MSRTVRGSTHDDLTDSVTVVRTYVEEIEPSATVRHYDQLTDRSQAAVAAAVDGHQPIRAPDLSTGDVVRYTGYYEVRSVTHD
ncbi:hypothetical protein [Halogeometricum borinquense]|uniref:hypothetical protein n=1 Tax=Halogeometricum borinquense TaxID=60847 RepID=UPI003432D195